MDVIKFGTDGWRAIIAREYTVNNVKRLAKATADWMNGAFDSPSVVIGYDCRFQGQMFAEEVAAVFCANGIKVYFDHKFASTPMVSYATVQLKASLGVVITASHNPPAYNGYKLKGHYGGPSFPSVIEEVENNIKEELVEAVSFTSFEKSDLLEYVDFETMYYEHIQKSFDIGSIQNEGITIGYDAMYGAGQDIVRRVFPKNLKALHAEFNPSFLGTAPEPIAKNLAALSELVKNDSSITFGFANDGDADRIGVYDEDGRFIDSHHLMLLLIIYMHEHKGMTGKVLFTFSCSNKLKKLCESYGLPYEVTKVGFKYICELMVKEDILLGGEESGGIAVKGHIPERDGVWIALLLLEYIAKSKKTIKQLIQEVYDKVGSFAYERYDMHVDESIKQQIIKNCKQGAYSSFGNLSILRSEDLDGYKYYLQEDLWVMVRPSGTEPVLRVYCEAETADKVKNTLQVVKEALLDSVKASV